MAEIALEGEIRLLRVRIHKVLCLRIAEGLEAERQEWSIRVQIILVEKNDWGKFRAWNCCWSGR